MHLVWIPRVSLHYNFGSKIEQEQGLEPRARVLARGSKCITMIGKKHLRLFSVHRQVMVPNKVSRNVCGCQLSKCQKADKFKNGKKKKSEIWSEMKFYNCKYQKFHKTKYWFPRHDDVDLLH